MSWENVSYIIRSRTRKAVLLELKTPKTPTMLATSIKTSLPNVSRSLRQLKNNGFVVCLTPKQRVGKIYSLTEKGQATVEKITKMSKSS
jgi:predicted transcriptional regulator